jgi:hypothetical protein
MLPPAKCIAFVLAAGVSPLDIAQQATAALHSTASTCYVFSWECSLVHVVCAQLSSQWHAERSFQEPVA